MSKIGKLPIAVQTGVAITVEPKQVIVKGPKGELCFTLPRGIKVTMQNDQLVVQQEEPNDREVRPLYGLVRATLANMIHGVDHGFEKKLELSGVGYRAQIQGNDLQLSLGFSHPVKIKPKPGLTFSLKDNVIIVSGIDKVAVGNMAAKIRAIRPPEPYKGKGIKYVGEYVRRKAGKAAKAVGGK